ncbi:ribosomal protein L29 [Orientia chuto str. Dubai]|uniref:Large ribosomal subunit protein uL29 n=1 Tax=Orientia chuto str. Dubai TaxID=1359168 RepID=A0A0F3MHW9_9RICK|nr:50S ribosomal protein L29 [Candidatus Orientia mediorientalis]KJV55256.1 ribosomal protein L29 [Orientia chuto str. Dubai]
MNEFEKYSDLFNIELQDLNNLLLRYKKELFNARLRNSIDGANTIKGIAGLRRKVAQIKTQISKIRK